MNDNASLAVGGPSRSGIGGLPQRLVQDGLVEESAMAQAVSDAKDKRTSVVSQLIATSPEAALVYNNAGDLPRLHCVPAAHHGLE